MYTPRHFAANSDAHARRLIREFPFATLITSVDGGEPHITHIPILFEDGVLVGHMARANQHWQAFAQGRTVAVFHGPHAYISPRWYTEPDQNVPTWNYATVHVHGRPQMMDADTVPLHIGRVTAHFEQNAWAPTPEKVARLAPSVVGFRMRPERIETKLKMNQNRTAADRVKVVATLRASGRAEELAVADWILLSNE